MVEKPGHMHDTPRRLNFISSMHTIWSIAETPEFMLATKWCLFSGRMSCTSVRRSPFPRFPRVLCLIERARRMLPASSTSGSTQNLFDRTKHAAASLAHALSRSRLFMGEPSMYLSWCRYGGVLSSWSISPVGVLLSRNTTIISVLPWSSWKNSRRKSMTTLWLMLPTTSTCPWLACRLYRARAYRDFMLSSAMREFIWYGTATNVNPRQHTIIPLPIRVSGEKSP
mmetsp:Transcript_6695/g.23271  ORF Transcript_6695/g.23271 Transcript_6695/m.23271 type:complete len:226 (-) Transcript_6695:1514-2191(-)